MSSSPNLSFWEQESFFSDIDVTIIGSGIVGLNAAIRLKEIQPKWKIVILERGTLPSGASTRNAGFTCFGSLTELLDDLQHSSEADTFALVERRWRGLQKLRERVGDKKLAYWECGGFELFRESENKTFSFCESKIAYFNEQIQEITGQENCYKVEDQKIKSFGFEGIQHIINNRAEGQINTGKMMASLLAIAKAKGIQIYNGISVKSWEEDAQGIQIETTTGWIIKSPQMIIATNGFSQQLLPELDLQPARNQVLITKPIKGLQAKGTFHYNEGYYYFRNVGDRLLLGGGRNLDKETETTNAFGFTDLIQNELLQMLQQIILPQHHISEEYIEMRWSGILGVGASKQPILKKISDKIVLSVRLGGMGVAIGSLLGEEAADLLLH